jgi:hypothetical protein
VVRNCIFRDNGAATGGGVHFSMSSHPRMYGCTVEQNTATDAGGGVATTLSVSLTMTDCTIEGNTAGTGGGISVSGSHVTIEDCLFRENTAGVGGAVALSGALDAQITGSGVIENEAQAAGGIHVAQSALTIRGSEIWGNGEAIMVEGAPDDPVDARFNWWGTSSGPQHPDENPDGVGDTVSDFVLFQPWYEALGVAAAEGQPTLHRAFPNPLESATTLTFSLPLPSRVSLGIYDAAGRVVTSLVEGNLAAGPHLVRWDGSDAHGQSVAQGVYFARIEAGGHAATERIVVVR